MAPLSEAIRTEFAYERQDGTRVYKGTVDPTFSIGAVPHGGYVLALVMHAALLHQSAASKASSPGKLAISHPDPAHLTAQFISSSSLGPLEIHIKTFSATKRWTRLDITLCQYLPGSKAAEPVIRVRAHAMFTVLPALGEPVVPGPDSVTVLPNTPVPYARVIPLKVHPAERKETPMFRGFEAAAQHIRWSEADGILGEDEGGRHKLEWGAWLEMKSEKEDVTLSPAFLPFFADLFRNGPELLGKKEGPRSSWYPTLTFSLDFKARFPLAPTPLSGTSTRAPLAPRTVGIYGETSFIHEGRHDQTVEVWSAPSGIGEDVVVGSEEWRKGCQILGISTQARFFWPNLAMALVVPFEINTRKANGKL